MKPWRPFYYSSKRKVMAVDTPLQIVIFKPRGVQGRILRLRTASHTHALPAAHEADQRRGGGGGGALTDRAGGGGRARPRTAQQSQHVRRGGGDAEQGQKVGRRPRRCARPHGALRRLPRTQTHRHTQGQGCVIKERQCESTDGLG